MNPKLRACKLGAGSARRSCQSLTKEKLVGLSSRDQQSGMKKEATVLNVICAVAALGFVAFAAFNAISSGDFFTTDNLFLTAVCLLFALVFAVSPLLSLKEAGQVAAAV